MNGKVVSMAGELFDEFSDIYDSLIDWPQRLAHETPFYRRLFSEHGVQRVADVACGTGQHAGLFHSWSLQVDAADVSRSMIERARSRFGEREGLTWSVRGFDQPLPASGAFDAAVCVGNSLALAADAQTAEQAVARMLQAVRPGGVIVVHVLNLWRLEDGPCVWQKCKRAGRLQGDVLIHKGVHRCGRAGFVDLLVSTLDDAPEFRSDCVRLLGLEREDMERFSRRAGAAAALFFGGYENQPYERETSTDLIMVATR